MISTFKNQFATNRRHLSPTLVNTIRHTLSCLIALWAVTLGSSGARASVAYGSINNFDTVNDTGVPAHGFEIELDDCQSADITYTYDWNHYGVPTITADTTSVPGHTNVFVRYASVKTNGVWAAFTAVPSAPIAPTQGHQFTNPSVNFGGEHFGVGYRGAPTAIKYNWLIDNGAGLLVHGPPVNVATPTFTYLPPAGAVAAQVQAAIVPPPPPHPPVLEFGSAGWVKEIRTTSHTNNEVRLRDLISPDPDYPEIKDWRNGEPDEVEVEWQLLQIDYAAGNGGARGELVAAAEPLNQGDDVVTRRYEFYQYVGPLDPETGEVLTDTVGTNGVYGTGSYSNTVVVGLYLGAQMSGFNAALPLGLIDHLPDGEVNQVYANRSVVIAAETNFTVTSSGALPSGLAFDQVTGQVYGTPTTNGVFTFHVTVTATNEPVITKTYLFSIAAAGAVLPPHSAVDTSASPTNGGNVAGQGVYTNGVTATVVATPNPGFAFVNWTDNGLPVTNVASYPFTVSVNRSLVANFAGSSTNATKIIGLSGSLVFGNVMTGTTTTATLTIHNTGNTNLTVGSIVYPSGFSGPWIGTIPAGGSHDVTVTFAPLAVASYTGPVTVASDATSGPNTIAVSGAGVTTVTPTKIIGLVAGFAFGSVTTGTTATATLTIHNTGNATLTVTSLSYPNGFSGDWSGAIPAGGSQDVTVTFAPSVVVGYNGTATVNCDATGGRKTFAVSGEGIPSLQVAIPTLTPDSGTFSNAVKITLNCITAGATIRYTIDGTDPTVHSTVYKKTGISLTNSVTLKAQAFKGKFPSSPVAMGTFTLIPPPPLTITTTILTDGKVKTTYGPVLLQATGGVTPYKWSLLPSSKLPAGLTLKATTGVIAGKPAKATTLPASITVKVTDTRKQTATQLLTLTITN